MTWPSRQPNSSLNESGTKNPALSVMGTRDKKEQDMTPYVSPKRIPSERTLITAKGEAIEEGR